MIAPWTGKTGLGKLIAMFATALGIATGLCGLNFVGVMATDVRHWSGPLESLRAPVQDLLTFGACAEVLVMGVSVVALAVLSFAIVARDIARRVRDRSGR